jgi:ABC-type amino acid transport substrate-binding protein
LLFATLAYAADPVLGRLQTTRVLRMGFLENASPFSYMEGGEVRGYSVGLCTRVAEHLREDLKLASLRIEWVPVTQANRFEMVESGRIDVECGTSTWTFSRQQRVEFSLMTFVDGGSVLVRNDQDLFALKDLDGKRLAVVKGTTTERSLTDAIAMRGMKTRVTTVGSAADGLEALDAGKVDGFAADRTVLIGLALGANRATTFRVIDEDFSMEPYALVLPKNAPEFRIAVNRALARLYRTGEIMNVYDRWLAYLGKPSLLLNGLYYLQRIPE